MTTELAPFTIYVDADACPGPAKQLIFKAALKRRIPTLLVANRVLDRPKTRWIEAVVVEAGPDKADEYIVEHITLGDMAITADIPLAAQVLEKGALAIDHRGKEFTESNIREWLAMRDFSADLREAGIQTSGPKAFGPKDRDGFANALDRCLTRLLKKKRVPLAGS